MKKLLIEFLANVLAAVIGCLLFSGLYQILKRLGLEIPYGGDKGAILFPLLLGLPLGAITGTVLCEKLVYETPGWNVLGILFALIFSVMAYFLGLVMMDTLGGESVLLIPFLVAIVCLLGYRLGLRILG